MKALIVGAGPGGLTAALWLAKNGIDCEIFESAGEIRQLGVGLNLLPHAVRELTILGLQNQLAASSVATAELAYYNKFGAEIWREPRGLAAGYKWPQYSVLRPRFQKLLLDAALERIGAHRLHTGHHLAAFTQDERGVTARFVGRNSGAELGEARGDILVGADGIHSVVRKYFYPDELLPEYCGRVLWRATSEAPPFLTGRSMIMAGYANCKFVAYPLSEQRSPAGRVLINWVADVYVGTDKPPVPRDWNRRTDKATVLRYFSDWKYDWLRHPRFDRRGRGRFRVPAGGPQPGPAVELRQSDAARRCRAPDVSDRFKRRLPGDSR